MGWAAIISALFKPVILPILSFLVGWLVPSPAQSLAKKQADINAAEVAANGPDHKTDDLDKLP